MEANRILLANKYARIISDIAMKKKISRMQAMDVFYRSETVDLLDEGISDLHCEDDAYLADEVQLECMVANANANADMKARMQAYAKALRELTEEK
ncbi:MAG: DUF3791 domain-containing protein [Hespellia sp.]|nr:DUF3791 domain-containing protein [Hespellia sp.]